MKPAQAPLTPAAGLARRFDCSPERTRSLINCIFFLGRTAKLQNAEVAFLFFARQTSPLRRGSHGICGSSQVQRPPRPVRSRIRANNRIAMSLRRCALGLHRCRALRPQHALARPHTTDTTAASARLRAVFLNGERLDYDGEHLHCIGWPVSPASRRSAPTHRLPRFPQDVSTTRRWRTTM